MRNDGRVTQSARLTFGVLLVLVLTGLCRAETPRTSLIIVGGGLLPNNTAVFERLIEAAKVGGRTRFGIFSTASKSNDGAKAFEKLLIARGVSPEHIQVIELTEKNAEEQAKSLEVVEQIRGCTAIFFAGGDQNRIMRALRKKDGTPTPAFQAIHEVFRSGGVIAGTSAGAAVQSHAMITISGLPDDSLDDGMDALDFGLTKSIWQSARRGLLVTPGLGFFKGGIIDQHFSQFRGRLARLARATIEEKIRFGFGIDEDTALAVAPDGTIEVLGPGCVTLVDSVGATCKDSPLGCWITGVHVSCLQQGDRFNPQTGAAIVHPGKKQIEAGKEENNGNYPIPDIAGQGAVPHALIAGLGNNTSRKQIGIVLKHNQYYGHGYRYTFLKTDQTRSYVGDVNGTKSRAVTDVRLNIEPVALTLQAPETGLPLDLPIGPSRKALEAISFRGIMLADQQGRFRPNDPITRSELACAIAQTIRLEPARGNLPAITDVLAHLPEADEIALVVAAGLMVTECGSFRPADPITRQEAATVLVRLAERYRSADLPEEPAELIGTKAISPQHRGAVLAAYRANLLKKDDDGIRPHAYLTREETAEAIYKIVGFP